MSLQVSSTGKPRPYRNPDCWWPGLGKNSTRDCTVWDLVGVCPRSCCQDAEDIAQVFCGCLIATERLMRSTQINSRPISLHLCWDYCFAPYEIPTKVNTSGIPEKILRMISLSFPRRGTRFSFRGSRLERRGPRRYQVQDFHSNTSSSW